MIEARPYSDLGAMAVLQWLDPADKLEGDLMRGEGATHLANFAEWRAMEPHRLLSLVLCHQGQPFALLGLSHSGQFGVAQAALVSRDHARHRRSLAQAAVLIRRDMPIFCAKHAVSRVEARCWAGHPTAPQFLMGCGFSFEVSMEGFGAEGAEIFNQFAWTAP